MSKSEIWGKKFGKLIVAELLPDRKCKCICECGNEVIVFRSNLTLGHTKSCGCMQSGVVGQKIGKFYVDSEVRPNYYKCICECGTEEIRSYKSLKNKGEHKCRKCIANATREGLKNSEKLKADYVYGTQLSKIGAMTKSNKSGVVGVNWDKSRGKWQASLRYRGKKINLGRFDYIEDAITARKEAEEKYFGEINKNTSDTKVKRKETIYTFKDEYGYTVMDEHIGTLIGARTKALKYAKENDCAVSIIKNGKVVEIVNTEE